MNMRVFIIILWLILGVVYWWIWDSGVDNCCKGNAANTSEQVVTKTQPETAKIIKKSSLPLAFKWDGEKTILGEGFNAYKDSILNTLRNGEIFEITGYYRSDETNNSTYENLGLARANETRKLFSEIPDSRIRLFGKLTDAKDDEKTNKFVSTSFKSAVNTKNIKEVDDKALIYFPFNSTNKLNNSKIENYLSDVAERVIKSGEKVSIVGHTDDIGSDESNVILGQRRADVVKNYLISKGVPTSQLIVTSKGEKSPVASNDSSANRALNRRVELKIN